MICLIDDDNMMLECIAKAIRAVPYRGKIKEFSNAITAISEIGENADDVELIFLDILLDGPNGFTFLNELMSYDDTKNIPIVVVTSLNIKGELKNYGIVGILDKTEMLPQDIQQYVRKYCSQNQKGNRNEKNE